MQVPGGKLTSAQQAKLRAEAVQQTHRFFVQSKAGKNEETGLISPGDKNLQAGVIQKMPMPNSGGEVNEGQCLPTNEAPQIPNDGTGASENIEVPAGEE